MEFLHGGVIKEVWLAVRDLDRAIHFYTTILGLDPSRIRGNYAVYELEGSRFIVKEEPRASRPPPGSSGLYHVAFTVNSMESLAGVLRSIMRSRLPLMGAADHGFTLAIYTVDPEGNGVEVYWDKPGYEGKLATRPLDLEGLASLGDPGKYAVSIGHYHIKVKSLEEAEEFYSRLLGMRVTERGYPGALFFAYGDYHHHVGANVWETRWGVYGEKPPRPHVGLDKVVISPPRELKTLRGTYEDPAGHIIHLV